MSDVQMMANDVAVGFAGASGYLEMNVYKPVMIFNIANSITIATDGCTNFRRFLIEGTRPNVKKIKEYVERSLMLVTALTLKTAALELGFVRETDFDRVVDPRRMVHPYVASKDPAA